MKIFIGKIPNEVQPEEIRDFFGTFGEIADFNFKGSFAFVEYREEEVARRVLENRDYTIKDFSVFVEESVGKKRSRYDGGDSYRRQDNYDQQDSYRRDTYNDDRRGDSYGRQDNYGGRSDNYGGRQDNYGGRNDNYGRQDNYDRQDSYNKQDSYGRQDSYNRPDSYGGRQDNYNKQDSYNRPDSYGGRQDSYNKPDSYGSSYGSSYGIQQDGYNKDSRDDCPHCSRCEVHGTRRGGYSDFDRPKRPKRDHPNDVNKFVIENLPMNASINEIEDFVKKEGYDVVFSRLTARGDSAIIELTDISSKEDAMNKLQGKEINGTVISIRNFKTGAFSGGYDKRDESQGGVDLYGGIDG